MTVYWDEGVMQDAGAIPDILAEGDSWFSYWLPNEGNLLNQIDDKVLNQNFNILSTAYPGDEAVMMLQGQSRHDLIENLKGYNSIKVILFSGGGNDFASRNLSRMLRPDCSAAVDVEGCFKDIEPAEKLEKIEFAFRELIALRDMFRPDAVIVTHDYDYAIPSGQGILGAGPWIKPYLDMAQVPKQLQVPCINLFIDEFGLMLGRLSDSHFRLVKTSGTLTAADWANELHPTRAGFKKLAECFRPVLTELLP